MLDYLFAKVLNDTSTLLNNYRQKQTILGFSYETMLARINIIFSLRLRKMVSVRKW